MKIILIAPPRLMVLFSAATRPGPPLGLAYIAGALKNKGHDVAVIDALALGHDKREKFEDDIVMNGLNYQEIGDRIPLDTEIIGIGCMFSGNWLASRNLINYLGVRFPDAKIMLGGEHVTAIPEYCLADAEHADVCVMGEGEETVVVLLAALQNREDLSGIQGIAYRESDGRIMRNERRDRQRGLDEIARPAWELFPVEEYSKNNMSWGVLNIQSLPILATRGCPYSCTFCSSPQMWGTKYNMRSVTDVVDEMEYLKKTFGITNFDFYDLTAIVKKDWIIRFCKELIARKLDVTWQTPAGTRSEVIDDEVAEYLKSSGCYNMVYAPESGSVEILKNIKKKVNLDNLIKSIQASKRNGLNVRFNIIMGFPKERHAHIWETLWFMIRCSWHGADDCSMPSIFNPYPGSFLFKQLEEQGKVRLNDDYFLEIPLVDTFTRSPVYNHHISKFMIKAYVLIGILLFYGTNYLFRPTRALRTIINIATQNYSTRGEMALGELLTRTISKKRPPPLRF